MTRSAWLLFLALSVVWGIPYFFIKLALTDLTPAWIAFSRVAVGALLLVGFIPRAQWSALRARTSAIVAVALTDIALPFYLIATGERTVSSSLTGLLLSSIPIVVTLLAFLVDRRERLTRAQIAGLAIGVGGVAALLGMNGGRLDATRGGTALILGAVLSYSIGVLMIKRWLSDLPPLATAAAMLAAAALMLAPGALVTLPPHLPALSSLVAICVLGAVCTAGAYVMYFALIARAGAIRATVVTYLNPAVAAILGVALLHESMSVSAGAGLLLVIAGSWLSTHGPPPPPETLERLKPAQVCA